MSSSSVSKLRCAQRHPDSLSLEWQANASCCEVQVLQGDWFRSWAVPEFEKDGEPRCRGTGGQWGARIKGLVPATVYCIQVRGSLAQGSGTSAWIPLQAQTSERPEQPSSVKCTQRLPQRLVLEWSVEDPEGAEVTSCEVRLGGSFSWTTAAFSASSVPSRTAKATWSCVLEELVPDSPQLVQIRALNAVGESDWSSSCTFKTSEPPTVPIFLHCTARQADRVTLEWQVSDPEGAEVTSCDVQVSGVSSWYEAAFDEAGKPRKDEEGKWTVTVVNLAGATTYRFRICGRNVVGEGAWAEISCRTSELPMEVEALSCIRRGADLLQLEWSAEDPEGAAILGCDVWVSGSISWQAATCQDGQEPRRDNPFGGKEWRVTVVGLAPATTHELRVRGRNAVGFGPWVQKSFKTSELPSAPSEVRCTKCFANRLVLSWRVPDPEGAHVTGCDVHLAGSVSWAPVEFEEKGEPKRVQDEVWECVVMGLQGDTAYDVRIRGINGGGEGLWAQQSVKTSSIPPEPVELKCLKRQPRSLLLQWAVDDPEGAEVQSCELQVGSSLSWLAASYEEGKEPVRVQGFLWQATLAGLVGDSSYSIKVRGSNAAGGGRWSQPQQLRTSEVPPTPSGLVCAQRYGDRLVLTWKVQDPEGAPVTACELQQATSLSWSLPQLKGGAPLRLQHSEEWEATILGLQGASSYEYRVRGSNESGLGSWSEGCPCRTSELPPAPEELKCLQRQATRLILSWVIADPEGAEVTSCDVQIASTLSWAPATLEPGALPVRVGHNAWSVTVLGLEGATDYNLRIRGHSQAGEGAWSPNRVFRTSDAPAAPPAVLCLQRLPSELLLEWEVPDPEGAPVSKCEVQIQGSYNWQEANLEAAPVREAGKWQARAVGLASCTGHHFRVRALNEAGEGLWSPVQRLRTSDAPAAPGGLRRARALPEKIYLEWSLLDPEGAPVESCDVQLQSGYSWLPANLEAPPWKSAEDGLWRATLVELQGARIYELRVAGCNVCGVGAWSEAQGFKTSEVPPAPKDFRCEARHPERLELVWTLEDPEGAPVADCEVAMGGSMSWGVREDLQAKREEGTSTWRVTLPGLTGDTDYDVRIRGRNICGEGAFAQGRFRTSEMPAEPRDLRCVKCLPDRLFLAWEIGDPEGSEVLNCEVEVQSSISWGKAEMAEPVRSEKDTWTGTLTGLVGATAYEIRIRGCNSAGGGKWQRATFRTSSIPVAPTELRCTLQTARRLALEWQCSSPEGADVTSCEVQICSSVVWSVAKLLQEPRQEEGGLWRAEVVDLAYDTSFSVSVRGVNVVGPGAWCAPLQVSTLNGRPEPPASVQAAPEGPGMLGLTWQITDPDDLEVHDCHLQMLVSPSIAAPYWDSVKFVTDGEPRRIEGCTWGAVIGGTAPDSYYTVAIYGSNAAGDGKWLQKRVRTPKLPAAPTSLSLVEARPDALLLEWQTADPEGTGAAVLDCDVQVSGNFFWQGATLAPIDGSDEAKAVREKDSNKWRALLTGLSAGSKYDVRICAKCKVGPGPWAQEKFNTLAAPATK